jgi:hypothetical protein
MIKLINTERPITENEFDVFESNFINKIPESFKNHYLKNNGGSISGRDWEEDIWGFQVTQFFSIKFGDNTIEKSIKLLVDLVSDDPFDELEFGAWEKYEFIPFASSYGGIVFMSLRDDDYGSIYAYDENSEGVEFESLSPSFDVFIKKIYRIK